jgi:hypothetical protein
MAPLAVPEDLDVFRNCRFSVGPGRIPLAMDQSALQASPDALHACVVMAVYCKCSATLIQASYLARV